jgi:transcriptional regulator with XRE-family HTH domain
MANVTDSTGLSEFLRSRRARVHPSDLGLISGSGRRRTQGLRREEVAITAGVSVDYYTRLEQGRERHPSDAVLNALAATLLLDDEEREYLFRVAAHSASTKPARVRSTRPRQVRPSVRRLLDMIAPAPAYLLNRRNDVLAANPAGIALLPGLDQWPSARRNTIRYIFLHPVARRLFVNWNAVAVGAVAHLRAMSGLHPYDRDLDQLIEELAARSEEFPRMWCQHDVHSLSTGRKVIDHPDVGRMELVYEVLDISDAEQRLVTYQAAAGTADHDAMMLLNMIGDKVSSRPGAGLR